MNEESNQVSPQQFGEDQDRKISLCHEARGELQAFDRWVSELNERIQNIPSAIISSEIRKTCY